MIDPALKREAFRKLPEEMRDWYVSDDLRAVVQKIVVKQGVPAQATGEIEGVTAELILGLLPKDRAAAELMSRAKISAELATLLLHALEEALHPPENWAGLDAIDFAETLTKTEPSLRELLKSTANGRILSIIEEDN